MGLGHEGKRGAYSVNEVNGFVCSLALPTSIAGDEEALHPRAQWVRALPHCPLQTTGINQYQQITRESNDEERSGRGIQTLWGRYFCFPFLWGLGAPFLSPAMATDLSQVKLQNPNPCVRVSPFGPIYAITLDSLYI